MEKCKTCKHGVWLNDGQIYFCLKSECEVYRPEVCDAYEQDNHGWHPFRQEQNPETGLWEFVDPPADGQHILITVNMPGHEPVQEDHWYDDMYGYLDSGYTPCAEAIAWKEWPEPYVPDYSDKKDDLIDTLEK